VYEKGGLVSGSACYYFVLAAKQVVVFALFWIGLFFQLPFSGGYTLLLGIFLIFQTYVYFY